MAGCDVPVVMTLLSLSQFFCGFAYAGFYNPNILDIAPPYAGTLFGITSTLANINGFLAPQLAGYLIRDKEYMINGWSNVWLSCVIMQFIGGSFYAAVASANRQPWADRAITVKEQMKFEADQFLFRSSTMKEKQKTEMVVNK